MNTHTASLIAAAAIMASAALPAFAQDGGAVIVQRGAQVETVRFTDRGGVTVTRGQPPAPIIAPASEAAPAETRTVAAGRTLWIVDEDKSRLYACELRNTTQVGGRRIRCRETKLPLR